MFASLLFGLAKYDAKGQSSHNSCIGGEKDQCAVAKQHWLCFCNIGSEIGRHTQHGSSPLNKAESLLLMMKRAYGMVSGSGMGPPMAARIPNIAPIFLVLPTLERHTVVATKWSTCCTKH